jgi:nitrite reductase (cytochrome c-552)
VRFRYAVSREGGGQDRSPARNGAKLQSTAQFYLDFVEAENSTGFHAPQEAARILGESVNFSRKDQIALSDRKSTTQAQSAKP